MTKLITIGSRGSDLALWQANFFQSQLQAIGVDSEIKIITTRGDKIQHLSFDKIEGKGFFTKEIESALINKEIDIAIHSHKDLETKQPEGLVLGGVSYRENPAELLIIRKDAVDIGLPFSFKQGAIIGTSSARRKSQIIDFRPDIHLKDIRGNVPTRINKLRDGEFDAILLAAAGVIRLGLDLKDLKVIELDPRLFIPAAAQGVLAYQCREGDDSILSILKQLHKPEVQACIDIERSILSDFGGGCHIPIGVYTTKSEDTFDVRVAYGAKWESLGARRRLSASSKEEALRKFEAIKERNLPKSVLITKEVGTDSFIKRACEANEILLQEQSMIRIEPLPFEFDDSTDWIFFSSKNAVKSFFSNPQLPSLSSKRFGAYGEATAMELSSKVDHIHFVAKPGQPENVAKEFADLLGTDTVLFPTSSISNKSISQYLKEGQYTHLPVYDTHLESVDVDESIDALIFTSPSNVKAFARNNAFNAESTLIAIGQATADELINHGVQPQIADFAHEAELFTLLCS